MADRHRSVLRAPPAPPPPSAVPLPQGWTEHRDPSGRVYYHNMHTNETTWYPPVAGPSAPAPPPPPPPPEVPYTPPGSQAQSVYDYGAVTAPPSRPEGYPVGSSAGPGMSGAPVPAYSQETALDHGMHPGGPHAPPGPQEDLGVPGSRLYGPPLTEPAGQLPGYGYGHQKFHGHDYQQQYSSRVSGAALAGAALTGAAALAGTALSGSGLGGSGFSGSGLSGTAGLSGNSGLSGTSGLGGIAAMGGAGLTQADVIGGDPLDPRNAGLGSSGTSVELELSAIGLKKRDLIGKSDPLAVVYLFNEGLRRWTELGRTETIMNNHAPEWKKRITLGYDFSQVQKLRFAVFDVDPGRGLRNDDELGAAEVNLAQIVRAGGLRIGLTRKKYSHRQVVSKENGKSQGDLIIRVHSSGKEGKSKVMLNFSGRSLDRKDGMLGKSDPYFIVKQVFSSGSGGSSILYKSEMIKNTLHPTWKPAKFDLNMGRRRPTDVPLKIECFDYDTYTPHDLIGEVDLSLEDLRTQTEFALINPAKKKRKGRRYTNSGLLIKSSFSLTHYPSFTSYFQQGHGLRLNFTVGVDFTASNGKPSDPRSLHHLNNPEIPNQYLEALRAVGEVLLPYIPDNRIAAFGFGAIRPPSNYVSFNFPLDPTGNEHCFGVEGLIDAYTRCLTSVRLSGPTNFEPLIRRAIDIASRDTLSQHNQSYHCLLILTDGAITDMSRTIDAIIDASHTVALSIIIIGVGSADFTNMKRLDADDGPLQSYDGMRKAKRDIVQFVPYRSYKDRPIQFLRADVLAELPSRIVETLVEANIMPNSMY